MEPVRRRAARHRALAASIDAGLVGTPEDITWQDDVLQVTGGVWPLPVAIGVKSV